MAAKKKYSRDQLNVAMKAAIKRFSHRSNVTGFDIGYQWTKDEPTKELCVRVHVEQKIPTSELESTEVFPPDIDGIPLDVIQGAYKINRATTPADHQARINMLMGGVSCGRPISGTGTIGAIVIDNVTGRPAILSNWHVLVGAQGQIGDPIVQPGPDDKKPEPEDIVAELNRSILGLSGDAAIALLTGARNWLPISYGSYHAPQAIRDSRLGEVLEKSGRTTGQTRARVDGEGIYRIEYEVRPGKYELRDITGFKLVPETPGNPNNDELSKPGDSGSVWINPNSNDAVGLHFAGETNSNPAAEHAIACNMSAVTEELNIRMANFDDLLAAAENTGSGNEIIGRSLGRSMPGLSIEPDWPWGPDDGPWIGPRGPWGPWGPNGPWGPAGPRPPYPPYMAGGEIPWPKKWKMNPGKSPWLANYHRTPFAGGRGAESVQPLVPEIPIPKIWKGIAKVLMMKLSTMTYRRKLGNRDKTAITTRLNNKFNLGVSISEIAKLKTVGDIYDIILKKLGI
ncbi:MAG: hypothetical protein GY761_03860 [Hyphomicrobiales bacterium]|nr:hypothetical protein [Hyphomicrobiales bacterium]